jgi:hypothetical protein
VQKEPSPSQTTEERLSLAIKPSLPDPTIHSLKVENPEDVSIVKEYLDVFPE